MTYTVKDALLMATRYPSNTYTAFYVEGYNPLPQYVEYHVTGVDWSGKRLRVVTTNLHYADGFHPQRGTLWGVLPNGKRETLRRYGR